MQACYVSIYIFVYLHTCIHPKNRGTYEVDPMTPEICCLMDASLFWATSFNA